MTTEVKVPRGQPTKYKPEFCELLIEHMSMGMSYSSFAGHPEVRVCRDTLYEWEKANPEFSYSKKRGVAASEYYMLQIGHSSILAKENFNNAAWIFLLKNLHGYRDRQEVIEKKEGTVTIVYEAID